MHKKDLIVKLRRFVATDMVGKRYSDPNVKGVKWKGQKSFAMYLIEYLEALVIPADEKYDSWDIEPYLPQILTDAFETLRTGQDELAVKYRAMYERETEHPVPNILDLGVSDAMDRASAVQTTLRFMMEDVVGNKDWRIGDGINSYCNAQLNVLQHTFDKFARNVYRKGMYEMISKNSARGMSGKFGRTELRTFVIAGRIMLTFVRRRKGKTTYRVSGGDSVTLPYIETSVSFVAEDGDPLALSAGIQSIEGDFVTSLGMIGDVIKHWPESRAEQEAIYKTAESVMMV